MDTVSNSQKLDEAGFSKSFKKLQSEVEECKLGRATYPDTNQPSFFSCNLGKFLRKSKEFLTNSDQNT